MMPPIATDAQLPTALRVPVAAAAKGKKKAVVASIEGLVLLPHASTTRTPANPAPKIHAKPRAYWVQTAQGFERGFVVEVIKFFEDAPIDIVVSTLATFKADSTSWMAMGIIIARCGLDAVEFFVKYAFDSPGDAARYFREYNTPVIAPVVAFTHAKLKTARSSCESWLLEHPEAAAIGLIPDAVGKSAKRRKDAEAALRFLATHKHAGVIGDVAQRYGDAVAAMIAQLLGTEAPAPAPKTKASMPGFVDLETLPVVLLRDRAHRLPLSAHERICLLVQEALPGIAEVKEACDPSSLADFVWVLFERWTAASMPSNGGWTLTAVGALGDDLVAVRLASHVRRWPRESRHARAIVGIDALATIGTDLAWTLIQDIADQTPYSGLRSHASFAIGKLALERGLQRGDAERLADRIAPRLGLTEPDDADGRRRAALVIDNEFTVTFDEHLTPSIKDASGARKPTYSSPAFDRLKELAKANASIQLARFERIMCKERRIDAAEFMTYFVRHPLLGQLARRLLWATFSKSSGAIEHTFRVVEDLTFANEHDEAWSLAAAASNDASIGIVHAAALDPERRSRWAELFAEYEILQPFPQLDRVVFLATEAELDSRELTRVNGRVVAPGRLYGLRRRGWSVLDPEPDDNDDDDGHNSKRVNAFAKGLGLGPSAIVTVEPGFYLGAMDIDPKQTITSVRLSIPAGDFGVVSFSELMADLETLA